MRISDVMIGKTNLPLGGHSAVTSRNTKYVRIERDELFERDDGVVGFRRSIHLSQDLLGEGLRDPIEWISGDNDDSIKELTGRWWPIRRRSQRPSSPPRRLHDNVRRSWIHEAKKNIRFAMCPYMV